MGSKPYRPTPLTQVGLRGNQFEKCPAGVDGQSPHLYLWQGAFCGCSGWIARGLIAEPYPTDQLLDELRSKHFIHGIANPSSVCAQGRRAPHHMFCYEGAYLL